MIYHINKYISHVKSLKGSTKINIINKNTLATSKLIIYHLIVMNINVLMKKKCPMMHHLKYNKFKKKLKKI